MKSRFIILLAVCFTLCIQISAAEPSLEEQGKALDIIANFADKLCKDIDLRGSSKSIDLEGKAKAELSGLLKKVANLGLEGSIKYSTSEFSGPLQKDLVSILERKDNCRLEIFRSLQEKLVPAGVKKYRTCRHSDFGTETWGSLEEISESSGWVDGGSNRTNWCNELIRRSVRGRSIGPQHEVKVLSTDEDARWEPGKIRHRQYKYHCKIQLKWNPIFNEKVDPRCGVVE